MSNDRNGRPSVLFWDVGGVLLTNGWDRHARGRAAERFELDPDEHRDRHDLVARDFETGRMSLDDYLTCTVFHRERDFTPADFERFMFDQSEAHAETLALLEEIAAGGDHLLATLNNESLELNRYRLERFGIKRHFDLFFCSCFLGVVKPEPAIYRMALQVVQREPEACLFIDDRELNLERAGELGIRTIHYQGPQRLRRELHSLGVEIDGGS